MIKVGQVRLTESTASQAGYSGPRREVSVDTQPAHGDTVGLIWKASEPRVAHRFSGSLEAQFLLHGTQQEYFYARSPGKVQMRLPFLVGFFVLCSFSITRSTVDASLSAHINGGVIVEQVEHSAEAENAGIKPGDQILAWSRGESKGKIESPFDWADLLIEQAPRGNVVLQGMRAGQPKTWPLGLRTWGLTVDPNLRPPLMATLHNCRRLSDSLHYRETRFCWLSMLKSLGSTDPQWLPAFLLWQSAESLGKQRRWPEADRTYSEAVEQSRRAGQQITTHVLEAWAVATWLRGDLTQASEHCNKALAIRETLAPNGLGVAKVLTDCGDVAREHDDVSKAEEFYLGALAIRDKLAPGSLAAASSLSSVGYLAWSRGDLAKADEYNRQALALREKLAPGSLLVAASLVPIGVVAWRRADLDEAEKYLDQAHDIYEKLSPNSYNLSATVSDLGSVAWSRGDLRKAEESYRQALAIQQKLEPGSLNVASKLNNIGLIAEQRGDLAGAERYHRRALAIRKREKARLGIAESLTNIGLIALDRGERVEAEECFVQALPIQEELAPGSMTVAGTLSALGAVKRENGDAVMAERYYLQALAIDEKLAPGGLDVASNVADLGRIASDRGDYAKAEEYLDRALEIRKRLAPESSEYAESLAALGGIMRDKNQLESAAEMFQQALNALESQTGQLGGSSQVRSGFRAKHSSYYADYLDLLMQQGQREAAFKVLERSRAQTLLEILSEARVDIRQGADASLIERERSLQASLRDKSNRRLGLMGGDHTEEQVTAVNKEIDELLSQYWEVEAQLRANGSGYAALTQPQLLDAHQVQEQLLDANTMLLEYSLGRERSYVFALTPTSLNAYELPKRSEIEAVAHRTYDLLTARNRVVKDETISQRTERLSESEREYQKTAAALSQMVVGPVAGQLGRKRLLVVSDGALQYIPFAVLPVPSVSEASDKAKNPDQAAPLVAEHEIVNLPSASVLAVLRRQKNDHQERKKAVAVLADPVFDKDDPRVNRKNHPVLSAKPALKGDTVSKYDSPNDRLTRSVGDIGLRTIRGSALPRLMFTRQEAASILSAVPVEQGMEALDFKASRAMATSAELAQYRIVHFATHGLLDNEHPELSGLVFSLVDRNGEPQDGFLELKDVYNLSLPADLVVLSACETGLGKEVSGEGLVGLTRGFMYAGAQRVVASLWKVDDVATAELMRLFYKEMLQDGLHPAAALRQAQLLISQERRWVDPYYWGAFTVQGEWR